MRRTVLGTKGALRERQCWVTVRPHCMGSQTTGVGPGGGLRTRRLELGDADEGTLGRKDLLGGVSA